MASSSSLQALANTGPLRLVEYDESETLCPYRSYQKCRNTHILHRFPCTPQLTRALSALFPRVFHDAVNSATISETRLGMVHKPAQQPIKVLLIWM